MILSQGSTYKLNIPLKNSDGTIIKNTDVSFVEFMFGDVRKFYGEETISGETIEGTVTFDTDHFVVPLTQEDTFTLMENKALKYQARVKFNDSNVKSSMVKIGYIRESLSKEVL